MAKRYHANPCLVFLNFVFLLASISFIGIGIWLTTNDSTKCIHFLQYLLFGVGLFMLLVALVGLIGACSGIMSLLYINFAVMLLVLTILLCTTAFILAVTSHHVSQHGNVFSGWLLRQVSFNIKSCTRDGEICQAVHDTYRKSSYGGLSSLQVGCCEPPSGCYNSTIAIPNSMARDCEAWAESSGGFFCSDCSSCKDAAAENIRHIWHQVAIFKVIALFLLIPSYFVSCCYFKQQEDDSYDSHGGPCQECLNCAYSCLPCPCNACCI